MILFSGVLLIFIKFFTFYLGLFKNQDDFPTWIGWIEYVSPYKYAYEALCINEYEGLTFFPDPIKQMGNLIFYDKLLILLIFKGFKFGMWNSIYVLIGFSFGYRILSFMFLKSLTRKLQ